MNESANNQQNDRVSDDAAKSLQNILNAVRTQVENEFAIQQMEYEELYGVDSEEFNDYLGKVGAWLKANKLIDLVIDLLPMSLMMDVATNKAQLDAPDPSISPQLPQMPTGMPTLQEGPPQMEPAPVQAQTVEMMQPEPPAPPQPPAPQPGPSVAWGAPPANAVTQESPFELPDPSRNQDNQIQSPGMTMNSQPDYNQPPQPTQEMQNPNPGYDHNAEAAQPQAVGNSSQLDSIFPTTQAAAANPQDVINPHDLARQNSSYMPEGAWTSADPEMKAPSMPMPPPPPPRGSEPMEAPQPEYASEGNVNSIPNDEFEGVVSQTDGYADNQGAPPMMPPAPPKMPPPPPPRDNLEVAPASPGSPMMPPSPPPIEEFHAQQAQAQADYGSDTNGFESGTWTQNQEPQPQYEAAPNPSDTGGWGVMPDEQQYPDQGNAGGWGESPPPEPQPQQVMPEQANPGGWGAPPQMQPQPQPQQQQQQQQQPQQPAAEQVNPGGWGAPPAQPQPQPHEQPQQIQPEIPEQVNTGGWGAPPPQPQPQPQIQQQPQPQPQAQGNAGGWGAPPAQPQMQPQPTPDPNDSGNVKKDEKEDPSYQYDPNTAWG